MTKNFDFNPASIDLVNAAARDMLNLAEPDGGFSMPVLVWMMVRTCTTGKQVGGIVLYPEELTETRERLGKLLDVATAGGWRGMDLLDTLMSKGVASDRLEALARKAGAYCDNCPELLHELFTELFGPDAAQHVERRPSNRPQPEVLRPVKPVVTLRRPMAGHFKKAMADDGEEHYVMTPEATLLTVAQHGYDPAEARDCRDGGDAARKMVSAVLKAADEAGYSRTKALRMILTQGPYGVETMAAIEHLTGECGVDVIVRGLRAVGVKFGGL